MLKSTLKLKNNAIDNLTFWKLLQIKSLKNKNKKNKKQRKNPKTKEKNTFFENKLKSF